MERFICAYTGLEHDNSEKTIEHIIPNSVGGSDEFVITCVSKIGNSKANKEIDEKFSRYEFIQLLCAARGIKSRRQGSRKFKTKAILAETNQKLNLNLNNKELKSELITHKKEYINDNGETIIEIECSPESKDKVISTILARYRGCNITTTNRTTHSPSIMFKLDPNMDSLILMKEFLKIAYGYTIFTLGESFVNSESAKNIRKGLWAKDICEFSKLEIKLGEVPKNVYNQFVSKENHLVVLWNLNGVLTCFINLFGADYPGCNLAIGIQVSSEADLFKGFTGMIAIVNPDSKKFTQYNLHEWLKRSYRG